MIHIHNSSHVVTVRVFHARLPGVVCLCLYGSNEL